MGNREKERKDLREALAKQRARVERVRQAPRMWSEEELRRLIKDVLGSPSIMYVPA